MRATPGQLTLKAFSVPTREVTAAHTPLLQTIGRVGGLGTIILLPLGLLTVLINHRRLRRQRAQVLSVVTRAAALQTQLATASAGYGQIVTQGAASYATSETGDAWVGRARTVSVERHSSGRPWARLAVALALVAAAAAIYLTLHSSTPQQKAEPQIEPPPTVAVAVLNAGSTLHAAHRLAVNLTRDHVHVIGIGNVGGTAPASYEVPTRPAMQDRRSCWQGS